MLLFNYKCLVVFSAEICYTNVTTIIDQPSTSLSTPPLQLPLPPPFSQSFNSSAPFLFLSPQSSHISFTNKNNRRKANHHVFNANNKHSMSNITDDDIVIGFLAGYGHSKVGQ